MAFNYVEIVAASAILGTVVACVAKGWNSVKQLMEKITSIWLSQAELVDATTRLAVINYLVTQHNISKYYAKSFDGSFEHTLDGKFLFIPYENLKNKTLLFWIGWKPLLVYVKAQEKQADKTPWWMEQKEKIGIFLYCLRGTINLEQIIKLAASSRNEKLNHTDRRRFFIKHLPDPTATSYSTKYSVGTGIEWFHEESNRLLLLSPEELGLRGHKKNPLANLIFPDHVMKMIEELKLWKESKDWYQKHSIPWKRGWCLYGPPGTGKSILIRAFAEELDMPMFVFSLGELLNEEFQKAHRQLISHVPCIALYEDFDNVFHGRENIYNKQREKGTNVIVNSAPQSSESSTSSSNMHAGCLSFDCLLNTIDGVEKTEGIFNVFTMNDITKLDAALGQPVRTEVGNFGFVSSRPGRIDQAIELTYITNENKIKMAKNIFSDLPNGLEEITRFILDNPDIQETPAQFQERCSQLAMNLFWEERQKNRIQNNGYLDKHLEHKIGV